MIALAFGLLAALAYATHDLFARRYASETGPFRMAFWIMVVGAVLLSAFALRSGTLWSAGSWPLFMGVLNGFIYAAAIASILFAFSLAPVSIVGPFTAGYPALVVVWGLFTGLEPTPLQWLAVVLVVAGAVIVGRFGPDDGGLSAVPKGKLALVFVSTALTCIFFAATVVVGQAAASTLGALETTFLSRLPAILGLLPLMMRDAARHPVITRPAWGGIIAMGILDVVGVTAINHSTFYPGKELGAMAIACYGALAVLLAMVFLKEKVTLGQWAGIATTVAGIILLGLPSSH